MKRLLIVMLIAVASLLAVEPTWQGVKATPNMKQFLATVPQIAVSPVITGNRGTTGATFATTFSKNSIIEGIYVAVTDTVESRGDSAVVALKINGVTILSQRTSAFKLPNHFYFSPVTPIVTAGALSYTITQTGAGAGVTEGTYNFYVRYFNP